MFKEDKQVAEPLQLNTLAYFNRDASCKRSRAALSKGTRVALLPCDREAAGPRSAEAGPALAVQCLSVNRASSSRVGRVEENLFDFREPRAVVKAKDSEAGLPRSKFRTGSRSGVTVAE